jgi:uncharacterized membrane protein (DUF106 family)
MTDPQMFTAYIAGFAGTFGLITFVEIARGNAESLGDLFDTPLPFLAALFWPLGLPFCVAAMLAVGAGHLARYLVDATKERVKQKRILRERENKLRELELRQAEKEVEKLLNG